MNSLERAVDDMFWTSNVAQAFCTTLRQVIGDVSPHSPRGPSSAVISTLFSRAAMLIVSMCKCAGDAPGDSAAVFPPSTADRADMLPTIASGSSKRGRKNHDAALRALAKVTGAQPAQPAVDAPSTGVDASRFEVMSTKDAPKRKRKPYELKLPAQLRDEALLHLPHGEKYTQAPHLPSASVLSRAALEALLTSKSDGNKTARVFEPGVDMLFGDHGEGYDEELEIYGPAAQAASRHRRRRLKQHENWTQLLSIDLLERYLEYKHSPDPRDARAHRLQSCSCARRLLNVTLADWDGTHRTVTRTGAHMCNRYARRAAFGVCMRTSVRAAVGPRILSLRTEEPFNGIQHRPARVHIDPLTQRRAELDRLVTHIGDLLVKTWGAVATTCTFLLCRIRRSQLAGPSAEKTRHGADVVSSARQQSRGACERRGQR